MTKPTLNQLIQIRGTLDNMPKVARTMNHKETLQQLGHPLFGARGYMGTSSVLAVREDTLALFVNGKPGYTTTLYIHLDAMDSYNVFMTRSRGNNTTYIHRVEDIYCEELQSVCEEMYDAYAIAEGSVAA